MKIARTINVVGMQAFLFVFAVIASFFGAVIFAKPAAAAPAQCYVKTGTNVVSYRTLPCDAPEAQLSWQVNSTTPQDGKCYLIQSWGSMQSSDQGAEPCTTWSGASAQTESEPPACRRFNGTDDEYNAKTADLGQLSEISCDEFTALLAAQNAAIGGGLKPGLCYIVMNSTVVEGKITWVEDTCWGIIGHFVAAEKAEQFEESQAINKPERNPSCTGEDCLTQNSLVQLVLKVINFMSIIIGIVIIAVIVWAGVQYASAGGNPNQTAEAKKRITNAIIALVMYLFLFAFLQWLVPGGVLK